MAKVIRLRTDCPSRKLTFTSKAKANKWLRQKPHHAAARPTIPYQCRHCDLWHLTSRRR